MKWTDAEDLALALAGRHPGIDPLSVRFTELRQWVLETPGFDDAPEGASEGKLEAIQMAWYEEWKDAQ